MNYDLLVVGQSREGVQRAISVAQSGRRAAIVKVPHPAFSLDLMSAALQNLDGQGPVTMDSWRAEVTRLTRCQTLTDDSELNRAKVARLEGASRFISRTQVDVANGNESQIVSASEIVIACGTRSWRPECLRGDPRFVLTVESLLRLRDIPQTIIVVGAGESGLSAATMFATLGVEVTVVDEHVNLLDVCSESEAPIDAAQSLNIAFRMNDEVIGTELLPDLQVAVRLASGRTLVADAILVCVGLEGNTAGLDLESVGVGVDERGRLWCDSFGRTWSSSITAIGDVVGFPRTSRRFPATIDSFASTPT